MWQFWLIISGIFFIFEMITVGFLVFWLGIGALLAMLTSLFTDNIIIQMVVFVISSSILLFFTKPFVDKYVHSKNAEATNAFSIIGKKGIVIEAIDLAKGTGQIKVEGEVWTAKTINEDILAKDTEVEIASIDGVKACVKPIIKSNNSSAILTH